MTAYEMRKIECPRCKGRMTVLDKGIEVGPVTKWVVDKVVCEEGCSEFEPHEVPNRED